MIASQANVETLDGAREDQAYAGIGKLVSSTHGPCKSHPPGKSSITWSGGINTNLMLRMTRLLQPCAGDPVA
jgi:hypothetical protein